MNNTEQAPSHAALYVTRLIRDAMMSELVSRFGKLDELKIQDKGFGDIVTEADGACEAFIFAGLKREFPEHRQLGEETWKVHPETYDNLNAPLCFVVDALDGTAGYARGKQGWGILIGERVDGVTVRAWILEARPTATGWDSQVIVAEKDRGIWISSSADEDFAPLPERMATRVRRDAQGRPAAIVRRKYIVPEVLQPDAAERIDTGATQFAWEGDEIFSAVKGWSLLILSECEAYAHGPTYPWDKVAGTMMVEMLGGKVAALDDGTAFRLDRISGGVMAGITPAICDAARADIFLPVEQTKHIQPCIPAYETGNPYDPHMDRLLDHADVKFLKSIVARYPETALLTGPAESTPEGSPVLHSAAIAHLVFDAPLDPTTIEAERTFAGLMLFKAAYNRDDSYFPKLSPALREALYDFTAQMAPSEADREFVVYSLACNDLGKTQALIDENVKLRGRKATDHDRLLAELLEDAPALFPGLRWLTHNQRQDYLDGARSDFNIGQMTLGENTPADTMLIQQMRPTARNLRLLAEVFDFAGARGHVPGGIGMMMTDDNLRSYLTAVSELGVEPHEEAYRRFIGKDAEPLGISLDEDDGFALGRIGKLTRQFTHQAGATVRKVWRELPDDVRNTLRKELNEHGSQLRPAIKLLYGPSVVAILIDKLGLEEGLRVSLLSLADCFEMVRAKIAVPDDRSVVAHNMVETARRAKVDPYTVLPDRHRQVADKLPVVTG